jgi:apolipoprotein N-acyltransferase
MTVAAERIAHRLQGLAGWRRLGAAFATGALSAFGFAPIGFFPVLLLAFAVLVLLVDGAAQSPRPFWRAAAMGWAFAFGQFLIGWHWIGYAFLVDPGAHLWQMPFALVFLTAGLALYAGLAAGLAAFFWQPGVGRIFTLAALYAAGEWLRGHLLTGFPWNLPGYAFGPSLAILQSTAFVGIYGLSFLTILFGASLAELTARRWRLPLAMLLLFMGLWGMGAARLSAQPPLDVPGVRLRLVQPDIPQREKYMRQYMLRNWQRLVDLSAKKGAPTHIVWPEAATGFAVARVGFALDQIAILTAGGQVLMTGSDRVVDTASGRDYFNSLYIFGPGGAPLAAYDKFHLVPFGEYVPLADLLGKIGVTKLTAGLSGFSSGDNPHSYAVPGAPRVGPLICYEIIFPGAVVNPREARPGWLVNVTDDSWFGPWAGPYQHLLIARVRAIEEGLPVARAANTGISAMIDSFGRVRASLGLGRMGVVDSALPGPLPPPLYARFGDVGFLLLLLASVLLSWLFRQR